MSKYQSEWRAQEAIEKRDFKIADQEDFDLSLEYVDNILYRDMEAPFSGAWKEIKRLAIAGWEAETNERQQ